MLARMNELQDQFQAIKDLMEQQTRLQFEVERKQAQLAESDAEATRTGERLAAERREVEARVEEARTLAEQAARERAEIELAQADLRRREQTLESHQATNEKTRLESLAALEAERDRLAAGVARAEAGESAARAEIGELEAVIEGLKTRLTTLARRVKELEASPAPAAEAAPATSATETARLERRRARLRAYKQLVQRQGMKVRKASEALTKRYEQVETVLAMRADLAAARQRLIAAERREQARNAVSKATASVAAAVVSLALISGLSWAIAREVAPARFAATALLKAECKERTLNDGELAEWQTLHENVLADPRLHESLAERFKRQGVESLSMPGQVADLTRSRLTFESGSHGELSLRLEGQGAEPTARTLEILTNGLTNFVNTGSIGRVDGATTVIAKPATASDAPIDSVRSQYALTMAAGGSLICIILGYASWRRLAMAKTTFEHDTHLAELIDAVPPMIERP
jgi:hypothetical protein